MAAITRAADASMDAVTAQKAPQLSGLVAGEDLVIGPCYVKASDGKVYKSNGTTHAAEATKCHGFAPRAAASGEPVTLFGMGTRFRYAASGLTPGGALYLHTVAGGLNDAPTAGDALGVAYAVTATDIVVTRTAARPSNMPRLKSGVIAGGAAGALTLTGITTADVLLSVVRLDRDSTAANINISDVTAEFTISAADTIDNTGGTNTTGDSLLVLYLDNA